MAAPSCAARWTSRNKWLPEALVIVLGNVVRTSVCSMPHGWLRLGKLPCSFLPLLQYAATNMGLPQEISLCFIQRLSREPPSKMLGVTWRVFCLSIGEILSAGLTGGPGRWSVPSGGLVPSWFSILWCWVAVGWSRPESGALLVSRHHSAAGISCLLEGYTVIQYCCW